MGGIAISALHSYNIGKPALLLHLLWLTMATKGKQTAKPLDSRTMTSKTLSTNLIRMEAHLEFLEIVPLLGLRLLQVMIEISCSKSIRVELAIGFEEQGGGGFLIGDSWIPALPFPHHVDAVWVSSEREGIATVGGAKVYCSHHEVLVSGAGAA